MKNLIIIGARGFGRELACWAETCRGYGTEFRLKGFLDDNAAALDGYDVGLPILDAPQTYAIEKDDVFVCALGDTKWKKYFAEMLTSRNGEFLTLVHERAMIGQRVQMGKGCVILADATLTTDIRLGDFVTVQPKVNIGHDVVLGDYAHINASSFLGGFAVLGEGATIHTGAQVVPGKKVGDWATVGAGSIVLRNVKPHATVFGIPATEI